MNYIPKQTELPVTIFSNDEDKSKDALTDARNKIEMASLHLQTIFNLIRTTALHYEGQAESREMAAFFWDVINITSVGNGVADSILASASDLTEFEAKTTNEIEKPQSATPINTDAASETREPSSDALTLAEKISYLINSPDVPEPISDGIASLMTHFQNDHIDQSYFSRFENSPPFIAELLKSSLFFTIDGDKTEAKSNENL